jgi:type IV pilus assembly protein PilM
VASGLGIDLGSSAVKAVRLRKRGASWQVLGAVRVNDPAPPPEPPAKPGEPLPPRVLPAGLRQEAAAAGLAGRGALGITGRDLMVKYVATPPVPPWKLRLMMDLEIKGTSGAEVCGDYAKLNIPGDLTRETVSLVAVAKTSYVESQMALARSAGLAAEWCCPNAVALFNAFLNSAQFRTGETTAVLDIGRDNLELVIQRDGVLYFARSAPGGGRRFTEAIDGIFDLGYQRSEEYKRARAEIHAGDAKGLDAGGLKVSGALREVAEGLAAAMRSAVMFCRAQAKISKLEVERVILSGGGARLRGLAEYLKAKAGVPVDALDPASRLDISRLPADQQALFEGAASAEFSVAIGLAQAAADPDAFRIAVLPDRVIRSRKFWRQTVWAIGAGAVLAGILAADYVGAARRAGAAAAEESRLKLAKAALDREVKKVQDAAAVNFEKKRHAELLSCKGQRNAPVLGFVVLLREVTPAGVTLEKLSACGPEEEEAKGAEEVYVKVSGRVDPGQVPNVFDTLDAYMQKLRQDHPGQLFKVVDARITTERSELERPSADVRRPFTFQARLATLGVMVEGRASVEGEGPLPPEPAPPPPVELPPRPEPRPEPGEPKEPPKPPAGDGAAF